MDDLKSACAKRLKECRLDNNYTLEEIGLRVGVAKSSVLRWENGKVDKIRSTTIKYLADLYQVSPIWLMGYDVPKHQENENNRKIDLSDLSDEDFNFILKQIEYIRWKMKKMQ